MKFVSLSFVRTLEFSDPVAWLKRIGPYGKVLAALAKEHEVFSIEQINYEGKYISDGVQYFFVQQVNRKFPIRLLSLVKKLEPDTIIVHGLKSPAQVIQLRRMVGRKPTIMVQSHAEKLPSGWRGWLQRKADKSIDCYLFTSSEMGREWVQKKLIASDKKIREAMVGASAFELTDREMARNKTGMRGDPAFLFVGRLDANKDPYTLIKGFSIYAQKHPSASLYMIFQDEEIPAELLSLVNEVAGKQIHLVGKIPHDDMQAWFNAASFIISTSHAEAFGMAVAEAMSCGCFPIVTTISSFKKLTGNGECGLLFEPGNVDQLASTLEKADGLDSSTQRLIVVEYYNKKLSADMIAQQIYTAASSV